MIEPFTLTLRFQTPAFLGNAEQSAEFRTPPIKAQLRHFWRMVQASRGVTKVDELRERENELFGSAAGNSGQKSLVRLRLSSWEPGKLSNWGKLATRQISVGKNPVAAALYLGFGPLENRKPVGAALMRPPAIDADTNAVLQLAVVPHQRTAATSPEHRRDIRQALGLMHHFGTLGGRSRNGWGSYSLEGLDLAPLGEHHLIDWRDALHHDWPCGLGKDEAGALLWQSREAYASWEEAMVRLAQTRADANRSGGERTLLSYPVTRQSRPGWNNQDRLPSSLRFKVVGGPGNGFRAQIVHFPCRPSEELCGKGHVQPKALEDTWRKVHAQLDRNEQLRRVEIKG